MDSPTPKLSPLKQALLAIEDLQARLARAQSDGNEPIAVIGMACRFPGGANLDDFWRSLSKGTDAIFEVPRDRWDADAFYDSNPDTPGHMATRWGGFLDRVDQFDPEFFGISPREAVSMDPQQRLLLEVCWEALEHSGYNPLGLASNPTGVFIGIAGEEYAELAYRAADPSRFDAYFASGMARSVAAGRISYVLGIQGPNLSLDTACSSSLVAVHNACLHLRSGECSVALAGGVNVVLSPNVTMSFSRSHMMASDGRCKTFDARADGFVRGEGCGVVVLKRLKDAEAEGDRILAVIRGSAVNQDGRSSGLTAPNGAAQEAVIRQALAASGVEGREIGYVEAHGTGTALGDPIEAHALAGVLGAGRKEGLVVGSVKTNIGHLEAAAGIAGLIKTILTLEKEWIPAHLHWEQMNPHIDWRGMEVEIPVEGKGWKRGGKKRIAGVSAFGFSGTNAHVIVEEGPEPRQSEAGSREWEILGLSAKTRPALEELTARYGERLRSGESELADLCYTAGIGRSHMEERVAVVGRTKEEIAEKLVTGRGKRGSRKRERRVGFLFSGQGSQHVGMGRELYEQEGVYRKAIEECSKHLREQLGERLEEVLYGSKSQLLEETRYGQPGLFAVEWGLAELWRSWGVEPGWVLGHSVGEYVAGCVAGSYGLEQGLKLVAERGRRMQEQGEGWGMLAVGCGAEAARKWERKEVTIAAVNGPERVTLSGKREGLEEAAEGLKAAGVEVKWLGVKQGYHSAQMEGMAEEFGKLAAGMEMKAPRVRMISTVTGREIGGEELRNAEHWRKQVRERVEFQTAMEELAGQGCEVYLEIGPGGVLTGLAQEWLGGKERVWASSMRPGRGESQQLAEAAAELYVAGVDLDWKRMHAKGARKRVDLPTYPFQRQRYWFDESKPGPPISTGHPLLGPSLRVAGSPDLTVWTTQISASTHPFLAEHVVHGRPIMPLTALFEMLLAASKTTYLSGITIQEPLPLHPGQEVSVQVIRHGDDFEVHSFDDGKSKLHATATLRGTPTIDPPPDLEALRQRLHTEVRSGEFYSDARLRGIDFGPSFRGIDRLCRGDGEALARIQPPPCLAGESAAYNIHPAVLDACLQVLGAVISESNPDLFLPFSVDEFAVSSTHGPGPLWSHAVIRNYKGIRDPKDVGRGSLICDVTVYGDDGRSVARVRGLAMRPSNAAAGSLDLRLATPAALRHSPSHRCESALLELRWQTGNRAPASSGISGDWLILPDHAGVAAGLAERLRAQGASCTILDQPVLLKTEIAQKDWRGVVHLAALDSTAIDALTAAAVDPVRSVCESALTLVQGLASGEGQPPRLWIVTRGAQAVGPTPTPIAPVQATLWGMAQAIGEEHPEWKCTCIDLDPSIHSDDASDPVSSLLEELCSDGSEAQVAFRDRDRFVARLSVKPMQPGLATPQRLKVSSRGVLTGLGIEPASRRPVPRGCLEIQVDAAGLNFRDVLNVLGMYPGDPGPLGSECAGRIVAVGTGVHDFQEGDQVVAMLVGGHDGFAMADARLVARKPVNLSAEHAATLPTAFLTARYTLEHLAKIKPGDRVLIHAATGGVGLAAVQIAQRAGAEVFATAGSERKRSFLRSLGVRHVMNSRTLDFKREILNETGGRGMDIVLNSLAGEFIDAGFAVLAPGGRFLEIGKKDLWTQEQAGQLGRQIEYHVVDLGQVAVETPEVLGKLLQDTIAAVERGDLRPLPCEVFAFRDAADAYRHMAQAQHIGKIVLRQSTCGSISSKATYLIAGAGGLGLEVAHWLVERGARNIVLANRSGLNDQSREIIDWAEAQGARIVPRRVNISQRAEMAELLVEIGATMPPLRGVVHAAAILDDGILTQQTWERFERVLAPKVAGSAVLHELTASLPLDFFVMFSSIASLAGAPGQANYAAANAFQDALAHERRRRGMPAISINWGPWKQGMANREGLEQRRQQLGMTALSAEEGLALLDYILLDAPPQVAAGFFDWDRFAQRYPAGKVPKRFSDLLRPAEPVSRSASEPSLIESLADAPESARKGILSEYVQTVAARVLGIRSERHIDSQRPLNELGLDSLMAVEFRNALAAAVRQTLPSTLLFSYPTIGEVTGYLAERVLGIASAAPTPVEPGIGLQGTGSQGMLENIEGLTDEEVDRLLGSRMGVTR